MFLFPRFEMASMGGLWLSFSPFPFPFFSCPEIFELRPKLGFLGIGTSY